MSATVLSEDDPDMRSLLACQEIMSEGEDAIRERMRVLAESFVEATASIDYGEFWNGAAAVVRFVRALVAEKIGCEHEIVDLFAESFVQAALAARNRLLE